MRKLIMPVAAAALLLSGPGAFADDEVISAVKSVDRSAKTLTLGINNVTYKLPDDVKVEDLRNGQIVRVTFKVGVNNATSVTVGGSATGTVKSLDEAKGVLTLDDGKVYAIHPTVDLSDLKPGNKVRIGFAPSDQVKGNMVAAVQVVN